MFTPSDIRLTWVIGAIGQPDGNELTACLLRQISALELIARAGGTLPTAVPSHAKLIRKSNSGYVESELRSHNRPEIQEQMAKNLVIDDPLQPEDIADAIAYAVTRARHIDVHRRGFDQIPSGS